MTALEIIGLIACIIVGVPLVILTGYALFVGFAFIFAFLGH